MYQPHLYIDHLLKHLSCYTEKGRVRNDALSLVRQINTLHPKVGPLVENNGQSHTLLYLTGTIQIYYRGRHYNIPVNIWLMENYPAVPPTCYVTPTRSMKIKKRHRHVDENGMVYLPYLNQWTHNHKLTELAGFMASVFSEEPPVFKAPTQDISNSSSNASHNAASSISSFDPASERYSSAQTQQQTSLYNNNSNNTLNSNTNMHASNHLPSSTTSSVKPMTAEELKKMETDARILTLKQELTTKLQQTMARINKKSTGQIDELFARQSRLQQGAQQLARCTGAMDSELKAVQASTQQLEQSIAHAQEWLQKHHRPEESLKVEEVLGATDTWSRDLMECVAKDNAISDTLLALDNALGDDTIDLRSFLKQVRSLGRKQFTARALAIKIQEKQKQAGFHLGAHRSSISIQNSLSALDAVADARNSSVSGRHPPSDPPTNQKNPVVSRGTRSRSSAILGVPPSLRASITSTQ